MALNKVYPPEVKAVTYDGDIAKMAPEELAKCMRSEFWRLNNLYWVMQEQGQSVKFHMTIVQYILYSTMHWINVVLKSRQHGITTFVCIFFLDRCLFTSNKRAGIIAHKDKDAKRIFDDKIKYAYYHIPEVLRERIPAVKDNDGQLKFANNSSIYVSTSMRSGTLQLLHVSEYGYMCTHYPKRAAECKSGAFETIHEGGITFVESTTESVGDDWQDMCELAEKMQIAGTKLTRLDYKFFFFAWFDKPENVVTDSSWVHIPKDLLLYFARLEMKLNRKITKPQRVWYFKKKQSLRMKMYKEHPSTSEEAFMAALDGAYYGTWMVKAVEEDRVGYYPHDPTHSVITAGDYGDTNTAIWFIQIIGGEIRKIDYYEDNEGAGVEAYARMLHSKPYVYSEHLGGPDMADDGSNSKSMQATKTVLDQFSELGIDITPVERHLIENRIAAVRSTLPVSTFHKPKTGQGVKRICNYHKEKNDLKSTEETIVFRNTPAHDINSHGADALGHFAIQYRHYKVANRRTGNIKQRKRSKPRKSDVGTTDMLKV